MVHAGISGFSEDKEMDEYDLLDFICERNDYSRRYYRDNNTYVITGHTPTMYINADYSPNVYIGNGHIAIDCGCIYGGKLAAYCIESASVTYVDAKKGGRNLDDDGLQLITTQQSETIRIDFPKKGCNI